MIRCRIKPEQVRIHVLMFIFFLIMPVITPAETVTLTIDEAVRRALEQSLVLKKGLIDLSQAEYSAGKLWSEIFPGINLSAGFNLLPRTPLFTDTGFGFKTDALSYSLDAGIVFSLNPSFKSSMKRIQLAYQSRILSYESASKQLEIQVIKNFLSLVIMKEDISYMEENLRVAEQILERDRTAWKNGLMSELDWFNSQLSTETARFNLSNAQRLYQNALGEFLSLLGMDTGTVIVFAGTVEIAPVHLDPEQLILEYLPKRPDIISQRQTIERLELTKNITTLNSRSPSLRLSAQWLGVNSGSGLRAPFGDTVLGSLALSVPVDSWIPGTKQDQGIKSADAEVEKAKLDLQNTEISAKTQIRSLILNLGNTWTSLEISQLRQEFAQRTLDAAEEGFRKGTVEFQELEDTRNKLTLARQQLLVEKYSYQSLLLDLAAALNVDWKTVAALGSGGTR